MVESMAHSLLLSSVSVLMAAVLLLVIRDTWAMVTRCEGGFSRVREKFKQLSELVL